MRIRQLEGDHERPGSWRLSRCSHETASDLTSCGPEQLQDELERVRDDFREAGIDAKPIVAYPFGSENVRVRAASRDAGYRLGYTIDAGTNGAGTDPFRLHRVMVLSSDGLLTVLEGTNGGGAAGADQALAPPEKRARALLSFAMNL